MTSQPNFFDMFVKFMLGGLILFCLFAFVIGLQSDNEVTQDYSEDSAISYTYNNLSQNLRSFRDTSQDQKTLFESENPTGGFGTILLFSIVSGGKVFNNMIVGVFDAIITLPVKVLQVDPIIIGVLSTILVVAIILSLWAIYKLGG